MSVEQVLLKANSHAKKGAVEEAQKLYLSVLQAFPKNKRARQGLSSLKTTNQLDKKKIPSQEIINNLINLYNDGHLLEAIEQSRSILERSPETWVVWNIMGAANQGLGRVSDAFIAFKKVIELNPTYAEGFNNLGIALKDQGKLDEALVSYETALSLKPDFVEACNNMGNILKDQGKIDEAMSAYRKALSLKPNYAEAFYNIGNVFQDQSQFNEAIASYEKAISLKPNYLNAYNNLGNIYKEQGKFDEAISAYDKVLLLKPDFAEAHYNIGIALKEQDKFDEAISAFNKALSLKPDYTEAHNNNGIILTYLGKFDEALAVFKKVLSLEPEYAKAYHNIGLALKGQGKLDEAIAAYNKAISLKPDYAEAYFNLGITLIDKHELEEAIAIFEKVLSLEPDHSSARALKVFTRKRICDWATATKEITLLDEFHKIGKGAPIFPFLAIEDAPDRQRQISEVYVQKNFSNPALNFPNRSIEKPEKLRIGYFSADFREHPVAYVIAKVIEAHNRDEFEVFGYSLHGNHQDELRQRLENAFDRFVDVEGLSDREVALQARQDNIDIAIDLMGYTKHSRTGIFAYRAAPIQINYLGYPGTMGADFMDYIVADRHIIPPENQKYFNEKVLYLPNTYMPTDNGRELSERPMKRSDMGLPEDAFVFCCFNNNYKITSSEFDIWMRLLNKVEGSVLWLRPSNKWAELNIKKEAQKRKVDPERIVFAGKVPMDEHLARHRLADLFIDTFAFNAHSTATEALWAGLPIVTKTGQGFAARVAGSLLNAVGLPELVTESEEAYEALAMELATNPEHLADIKVKLEANRLTQPLFNTKQYTNHLENGYQQVYQNYLDDKPPQTANVQK